MTISDWTSILGLGLSGLVALGPWMVMVHAKLAVIASRLDDLAAKVEKDAEAAERLWTRYAEHEARLETGHVELAHLSERLRQLEG